MIVSFGDAITADLFHGRRTARARRFANLANAVARKLDMLNAAKILDDLKAPPGNELEGLSGDLKGKHSIRVNKQWRLVFRWDNGAHDVVLVDYH